MDARLHRADRGACQRRDFLVAEALDVHQHDDLALVKGELIERMLKFNGKSEALDAVRRGFARVGGIQYGLCRAARLVKRNQSALAAATS